MSDVSDLKNGYMVIDRLYRSAFWVVVDGQDEKSPTVL